MDNCTTTLENHWVVSYKAKDAAIIKFSINPREMNTCSHKNLYMSIYMAKSLCCPNETITVLLIGYTPI